MSENITITKAGGLIPHLVVKNGVKAIEFYKQAADLLPSGHEKSREAQEWLEKLKP